MLCDRVLVDARGGPSVDAERQAPPGVERQSGGRAGGNDAGLPPESFEERRVRLIHLLPVRITGVGELDGRAHDIG